MDVAVHPQHGGEDGPHGPGSTLHLWEYDDKISGKEFYQTYDIFKTNGCGTYLGNLFILICKASSSHI